MDRPVRIAIANGRDPPLAGELAALPMATAIATFGSLFADTEALVAHAPDLLFVGDDAAADGAELSGAIRLLQALRPDLAVVIVAEATREVALHDVCTRTGARLLRTPLQAGELSSVVDHALAGGNRPREEVFLDLARGFADEINNPLLFLMGHLQLLQLQCETEELRQQLATAMSGAARIQSTVERVRLLAQAASGPRQIDLVDLRAELQTGIAQHFTAAPPPVLCEPDSASFTIRGDRELLRPAIDLLLRVAAELQGLGTAAHCVLTRFERAVRLRLQLVGPGLESWRLPRTFEPYYLNHLLRGSSHGLALFVVQAAVHGHRGLCTARRLPGDALAIDLSLRVN